MVSLRPLTCIVVCVSVSLLQDADSPPTVTVRNTFQQSDSQPVDVPQSVRTTQMVDSVWHGSNQPLRQLTGKFRLEWNDEIGDIPEQFPHVCSIEFKEINSEISGDFIGPVAGRERDAIISGRLEGFGPSRVLVFQQREEGYVCSYQAIDNGGEILGVWHDTQNRSGRFRLLKYQ